MKVPVKGSTECLLCDGTGYDKIDKEFYDQDVPCVECNGKGRIPTLKFADEVTEQINQWYNGR